jgi:hypothetical protein
LSLEVEADFPLLHQGFVLLSGSSAPRSDDLSAPKATIAKLRKKHTEPDGDLLKLRPKVKFAG